MRILAVILCGALALAQAGAQTMVTAEGLADFDSSAPAAATMPAMYYLALTNRAVGEVLTSSYVATNAIPANSADYNIVFSANAAGQFRSSTNGPAFPTPIQIGSTVYPGTDAHVINLSNSLNFATIEFATAGTTQSFVNVSGFVQIPALSSTPATYDLIVLASKQTASPYNTENWTLQINCGLTNILEFEDAGGGNTYKLAKTQYPTNTWLYFTMWMNTTNFTEYGAVWNTTNGALLTSYTNTMGVSATTLDYWLFGNNEAGSQTGAPFLFSGLNWTNTPIPPPPPPYTYASNRLVAQYKFNGNLTDASPNAYNASDFGGTLAYVTGQDGVSGHAAQVANTTISSTATNPVTAISVNFWINTSASGMPVANDEFTSWYAYVTSDGNVQFDLITSAGHINLLTTAGNWYGAWHMYTATWDTAGDQKIRIYRDGVLVITSAALGGTIVPGANLTIASGNSGYGLSSATLDDVRVYARALNASEISAIYAAGADGDINL